MSSEHLLFYGNILKAWYFNDDFKGYYYMNTIFIFNEVDTLQMIHHRSAYIDFLVSNCLYDIL